MKRGHVNNYDLTTEPFSPTHLMLCIYAYFKASTVDNLTLSFGFLYIFWEMLSPASFRFSAAWINWLRVCWLSWRRQCCKCHAMSSVPFLSYGVTVLDTVMNVKGPTPPDERISAEGAVDTEIICCLGVARLTAASPKHQTSTVHLPTQTGEY